MMERLVVGAAVPQKVGELVAQMRAAGCTRIDAREALRREDLIASARRAAAIYERTHRVPQSPGWKFGAGATDACVSRGVAQRGAKGGVPPSPGWAFGSAVGAQERPPTRRASEVVPGRVPPSPGWAFGSPA